MRRRPRSHRPRARRAGPRPAAVAVAVLAVGSVLGLVACSDDSRPLGEVQSATTERGPAPDGSAADATTSTIDPRSVPARPSEGCGRASAMETEPGPSESAIDSGGTTRTFHLRVPPAHDGRTPVPLVVDLHGFGEGAEIHTMFSGLPELGEEQGFVTVTPQGSGMNQFWNTFGLPEPDDVEFIGALLDDLDDTLCVDLARTHVAGISNGAFMASLLACRMADRVASIAAVAGVQDPEGCAPSRPVGVLAIHGTADDYVRYEGGFGPGVANLGVDPDLELPGAGRPVPEVVRAWAFRNACTVGPTDAALADDVTSTTWSDCTDGADVVLDTVEGGGHSWPGSEVSKGAEPLIGPTTDSIDASAVIWEFFRQHPLR